ncbi:hypothetical protein JM946_08190 [Steroidobacter sp. S1-65]|uniref:Uncharacterized protein n=1 Tax=Steroidobacter gossypii TaxID=2805490 RepID=A0ABS1WUT6_9GAMM|nr:hypothetical protein [Steroidobacter gossypii]MBM0104723.1 hypothetical protein [Steroidobacter gossypii]
MSGKRPIRVWTAPIVLAVLTSIGLISALVSDDAGDVLAWITLAVPVLVCCWYAPRRTRSDSAQGAPASSVPDAS